MATDLPGLNSRTNVALYNAGSDTAVVAIELRQTCDDSLLASTSVMVAPHSVAMSGGIVGSLKTCPSSTPVFSDHGTYIRVLSNQQGISLVTTLANDVLVLRANMTAN